jgi:small-conductance mechanosensitive channel
MLQLLLANVDIILKLVFSFAVLLFVLAANRGLRNLLKGRVKDPAQMHTLYMLIRNSVFIVSSIVVLFVWLGSGSNLTMAMGILGAGVAFASQEVIGSFAGYVNIVTSGLYHIGDRVRIWATCSTSASCARR